MERAAEILVRPLAWALSLFIRYLGFEDSPQAMLEPPPSEVVKTKAEGCDVFVQPKLCQENKKLRLCCTEKKLKNSVLSVSSVVKSV